MKKILAVILSCFLITALFASCGAQKSSSGTSSAYGNQAGAAAPSAAEGGTSYSDMKSGVSAAGGSSDGGSSDAALPTGSGIAALSTDKIIYSYSANIETTSFEESLKNVAALLSKYGAFIESSYISGNSYGSTTFRTADYTIRVPVKSFPSMTGDLTSLGNVWGESTNAQNITAQFTDTESRLDAYKTEESRLLAMLEKSATVADMITIESKLADVRYQIESLTSTLKNWQSQVDYSTVTLHITEVSELSQRTSVQRGYWQQISDGLQSTLKGIGSFFKSLFMIIVVSLPVILILAALAAVVLVIRHKIRKKRAKAEKNEDSQTK